MRRAKTSLIYKATGNLRASSRFSLLTNTDNTIRYFGIGSDDAISIAKWTKI
jgi:hypothetical protein